jgi:hypothetical protein
MFEEDAVVTSYRPDKPSFGYKDFSFYSGTDTYYVTNPKEKYTLRYILGVLNSSIADVWFRNRGKVKGDVLDMTGDNIENFVIPSITLENHNKIQEAEGLVDKILAITKSIDYLENQAKKKEVKEYEKQIDQLVYKLYDLTPEEIEIVENSNNKQ